MNLPTQFILRRLRDLPTCVNPKVSKSHNRTYLPLRVSTGRADSQLPLAGPQAEAFGRLAERWLPQALRGRPLAESLEAVTLRVRSVFREIFG